MTKHEYLKKDYYYESSIVNKGRSNKVCEHCDNGIPIGVRHKVHKFYSDDGDYPTYPTHINCSEDFKESLN